MAYAEAYAKEEADLMEKTETRSGKLSVRDLTLMGMMTAVMAVCAWITIPFTIPFTMQTFGVFITLRLLGGRKGTAVIGLYILLGIVGVPVFSGFGAGIGVLAGPTGGYIAGFLLTGLLYCVVKGMAHRPVAGERGAGRGAADLLSVRNRLVLHRQRKCRKPDGLPAGNRNLCAAVSDS